jgi:hypothetical protein
MLYLFTFQYVDKQEKTSNCLEPEEEFFELNFFGGFVKRRGLPRTDQFWTTQWFTE